MTENVVKAKEQDFDAHQMELHISTIENSWNSLNRKCNERKVKAENVSPPSNLFYDVHHKFSEWLNDAEKRLECLKRVPKDLKDAKTLVADLEVIFILLLYWFLIIQ